MQEMNTTSFVNGSVCTPLNNTDGWIYRNRSKELLFERFPNYTNASGCLIDYGIQEMCNFYVNLLTFDNAQLARVIIIWILFVISAIGNSFVIYCVYAKARSSHVHLIMLHFAIADLAFTFLVSPKDGIWNVTMQWYGGAVLCKICQACNQIGMYVSSFMLVVMALDRYCGIVLPMSNSRQRKRTKYLVAGAWILSILCALPAAYIFKLVGKPFCPDQLMLQCIDYETIHVDALRPYNFFTMTMSFIAPMILCVILYSLVACEITNMIKREIGRVGRRESSQGIRGARRKTLIMTTLVTLTFLVFWGPYYAVGIHYWFTLDRAAMDYATALFTLVYFHSAIHPFIYGVLMRDVRDNFRTVTGYARKIITCGKFESNAPSLCMPSHRESGRQSHKSNATNGNGQRQPAFADGIHGQNEHLFSRADEHVNLLNGNVTPKFPAGNIDNDIVNVMTRTSQVTFQLSDDMSPENIDVGLNNNKENIFTNCEDIALTSSTV